jgi:hypothetical protein
MGWRREPEDEKKYQAVLCMSLYRDDDGLHLGSIMRFYDDGPTYAHSPIERLGGAWENDAAAMHAVEISRR